MKNANIPDIGRAHRIKAGNNLSLPIITPAEGESTYVVFANNFRQALKIKVRVIGSISHSLSKYRITVTVNVTYGIYSIILQKSRDACQYNEESEDCQKDLKLAANVVFKITPDAFKSGSIGFPSVSEDLAILDRENGNLNQNFESKQLLKEI